MPAFVTGAALENRELVLDSEFSRSPGSLGGSRLRVSGSGCCGSPCPMYLGKQVSQARRRGGADTKNLAMVWSLEEVLGVGPPLMHRCDWRMRTHARVHTHV